MPIPLANGQVTCRTMMLRSFAELQPEAVPAIPFPVLVWDHGGSMSLADRSDLVRHLLKGGCRYAVCGGLNADAWELTFDEEFVGLYLGRPPEEQTAHHVMTTSHVSESPDDVAFFFVRSTNFDTHDFRELLVLHLGDSDLRLEIDDAVRHHIGERNSETGAG